MRVDTVKQGATYIGKIPIATKLDTEMTPIEMGFPTATRPADI